MREALLGLKRTPPTDWHTVGPTGQREAPTQVHWAPAQHGAPSLKQAAAAQNRHPFSTSFSASTPSKHATNTQPTPNHVRPGAATCPHCSTLPCGPLGWGVCCTDQRASLAWGLWAAASDRRRPSITPPPPPPALTPYLPLPSCRTSPSPTRPVTPWRTPPRPSGGCWGDLQMCPQPHTAHFPGIWRQLPGTAWKLLVPAGSS